MEKETVKKGLIGGVSAVAVTVGGFVWQNGGKDVAGKATKQIVNTVAPEVINQLPEPFKTILTAQLNNPNNQASSPNQNPNQNPNLIKPEQITKFQQSYSECNDEVAQNPKIDLENKIMVYDSIVKCLLINKNQGEILDKMSESNADLKETLTEIRERLNQEP